MSCEINIISISGDKDSEKELEKEALDYLQKQLPQKGIKINRVINSSKDYANVDGDAIPVFLVRQSSIDENKETIQSFSISNKPVIIIYDNSNDTDSFEKSYNMIHDLMRQESTHIQSCRTVALDMDPTNRGTRAYFPLTGLSKSGGSILALARMIYDYEKYRDSSTKGKNAFNDER